MIKKIQRKFALSPQGAKDLLKACVACVLSNIVLMFPVGLLYLLVSDLMESGAGQGNIFYILACAVCIVLIFATTYFQYNATYLAKY